MGTQMYLDLDYIPQFESMAFKEFRPKEHHITRLTGINILLLVVDGVLRFEEDGKMIELGKGEYYVQAKGKRQSGVSPSEEPKYYWISFYGKFTNRCERSLPMRGTFDVDKVKEVLEELRHNAIETEGEEVSIFRRQILFFDVLNLLYRGNIAFIDRQRLADRIAQYIDTHYTEHITLDMLSEHFSYSKDHIIRVFRGEHKITPYQYLIIKRLCSAKLMLTSTDMTVASIASACGFNDLSAFYYAFCKAHGCSPGEYRQLNGGNDPKN